ATSASTLTALFAVALVQRLRLWDPVVMVWLAGTALLLGAFIVVPVGLASAALAAVSSLLGNLSIFALIILFLAVGAWKRVPVYEAFVGGAKDGFEVARNLLPYLVAMLCAIGVLRASGALDFALEGLRSAIDWLG